MVFRKQPLYLLEVVVRFVYTLPFPYPAFGTLLGFCCCIGKIPNTEKTLLYFHHSGLLSNLCPCIFHKVYMSIHTDVSVYVDIHIYAICIRLFIRQVKLSIVPPFDCIQGKNAIKGV
uniref:Putative ovule protein n=1 Tax=Solanum chacoense TaxID=4108 RepID=A0A0V0GWL9_SOLCH